MRETHKQNYQLDFYTMDSHKLAIVLILLGLMCQVSNARTPILEDCSNNCLWRARCSPYYKDLVWTIENNQCRVFQNGCIFGSANCMRVNQCLKPMTAVTEAECKKYCSNLRCPSLAHIRMIPICAWFPYTDASGNNTERSMNFANRCELDNYACSTGQAYNGEPTLGVCNA